ncbi:MAG: Na+/H+ antiporter NhaD and related arsenite permeases, partial [uncultured Rubrobacteraceae bacterium]
AGSLCGRALRPRPGPHRLRAGQPDGHRPARGGGPGLVRGRHPGGGRERVHRLEHHRAARRDDGDRGDPGAHGRLRVPRHKERPVGQGEAGPHPHPARPGHGLSLGVSGQRHHRHPHGPGDLPDRRRAGRLADAVPAHAGDGLEHRGGFHPHRGPAEHPYRERLRPHLRGLRGEHDPGGPDLAARRARHPLPDVPQGPEGQRQRRGGHRQHGRGRQHPRRGPAAPVPHHPRARDPGLLPPRGASPGGGDDSPLRRGGPDALLGRGRRGGPARRGVAHPPV